MASVRSAAVLLAIVSVLVASTECARPVVSPSWLTYWQQRLPAVQVPASLAKLASPLTFTSSSSDAAKGDKVTDAQDLCRAMNMLCGDNPQACSIGAWLVYDATGCGSHKAAASDEIVSGVFLNQASLFKGNEIVYPKLNNDLGGRTFLPAHLVEDYMALTVRKDSDMAKAVKLTRSFCDSAPPSGELRTCHSSIESMVDFAASNMGTDVMILSPEYTSSQSQKVRVLSDPVTLSGPEQSSMACHELMYPHLMYSCHILGSSQILDVQLETERGSSFHATAVCHTGTTSSNEGHAAFAALGVKPGEAQLCHWLPQNNFIWIYAK